MKAQTQKFFKKSKLLPVALAAAVGLMAISVPFFAFSSAGDKSVSPTDSVSSSDLLPSDNNADGIMALSTEVASGECGTNVTWTLDDTGLLTISGSGAMERYVYDTLPPWYHYGSRITSVVIESGVTYIGDQAFSNGFFGGDVYSSLTSVTIPNSVTYIGGNAFQGCSGLTSVTIPDSVTSIGSYAFNSCSSLTSVTIPDSVTSIGSSAFSYCSGLTSINVDERNSAYVSKNGVLFSKSMDKLMCYPAGKTGEYVIPNSVTSIEGGAFFGCRGLTSVNVDESNSAYASKNGVLFSKSMDKLMCCPAGKTGEYVIPNSVTSIGSSAFRDCSGLTSVTIPNSVTSIGGSAFYNCSGLTSVTIPNSVTSIGTYAFYKCSGLTSVTIGNSVTSIGSSAFYYCSSLTSVTIGNSVTSIGSSAFRNCSGLTSVIIPSSVTSIGQYAFRDCSGLTSVIIPSSVTSIGRYAFWDCRGLTDIYYKGSETQWKTVSGYSNAKYGNRATVHFVCYSDETHDWQWEHDETSHRQVCSICSEERENSAGAHSFTNYVSNNNATCTEDGTETADCDDGCGVNDTRTEVGSKLGHKFTNYVSNNNATCTADGTETADCDHNCGVKDTRMVAGSKLGHKFVKYVSNNDATCIEDGTETAKCENGCGKKNTRTAAGSALGHSFTNYVSNNDATCTEDGTETADCDNGCGEKDTRTAAGSALGHKFVNGKCTVCEEADPLAKNNADTSDTLEKSGSLNPAILIVSLIALAAVAATAIIIILKRKKQQD